jgi:hypothetical protein
MGDGKIKSTGAIEPRGKPCPLIVPRPDAAAIFGHPPLLRDEVTWTAQ